MFMSIVGDMVAGDFVADYSRGRDWWDNYFMGLARQAATASRDPSTQSGAFIVRPDKTIASVGFNGFPRRLCDSPKLYADRATKYQRVIHSEMNAILLAREPLHGYTLYNSPFIPCDRCCVHVIQAGITRVVAPALSTHPERWLESMQASLDLFEEAGVEFTSYVGAH